MIGGVAGGASCAARARRLSEDAEIILFERGPHVSFANCGLPYFVGDVIPQESDLLMASPQLFKERFNIEIRLENEVRSIDAKKQEIEVCELNHSTLYRERYDALVLSPGASPIRPPLPGIDLPGIFALRTIPDSRKIKSWLEEHDVKRAAVVGGGFIGLEMTENLVHQGIHVIQMEMLPQLLPPIDREMASPIARHLKEQGVTLHLNDAVTAFERTSKNTLQVHTHSDARYEVETVILAIGVRPETHLAKEAGLKIGPKGGIQVDSQMRTSDPNIWAVGDAVEVRDSITGEPAILPLAGPANRQGRIASDVIFGRPSKFRGVQGTAVCHALGLTVAWTGASEKTLKRAHIPYSKVYLHPGHHARYFPGSHPIDIKLLFSPKDGTILGAQASGVEGVVKRIDVLSMALQKGGSVYDLEEAELCYAPQFGAAKDPVNFAGMIAANALRGDAPVAFWEELGSTNAFLLDVRNEDEFRSGHVEGATNIPLHQLREQIPQIPDDREIWTYCQVGQRAYYATRLLRQHGLDAKNLTGGYKTYQAFKDFS